MDKLAFAEGMKILSSCFQKDINNDDFLIWYELLQDIEPEVFKKTIINICKEKSYMPTIHDILERTNNLKNDYYLSILKQMKEAGYFKKGIKELSIDQEERNYDKSIRWIEEGLMPEFLKNDIKEFINSNKSILEHKNQRQIETGPPGHEAIKK